MLRIDAFIEAERGACTVGEQNSHVAGRLAAAVEGQYAIFRRAGGSGAVHHNIVGAFLAIFDANIDTDRRPGARLTVFQPRQRNVAHADVDDPIVARSLKLACPVHNLTDKVQRAVCRANRAGDQSGDQCRQTERDYFHFLSFCIADKTDRQSMNSAASGAELFALGMF